VHVKKVLSFSKKCLKYFKMKFDTLVFAVGAFRGKNREMVMKEISFVGTDENGKHWKGSYVLQAPYPESELSDAIRRTNDYISKNMLGNAKWDDGNIRYLRWEDLVRDLCSNVSPTGVIFVKGSELAKKLRGILPKHVNVYDLDTLGCSKAADIKCTIDGDLECIALCGLPNHDMEVCPMGKAIRYTLWWEKQKRDNDRALQVAFKKEHETQTQELVKLEQKVKQMTLNLTKQGEELKHWEQELDHVGQKQHKIAGHMLITASSNTSNSSDNSSSSDNSGSSFEGYTKMPGGYLFRNFSEQDPDLNEW
jgi:hypothetical protein